MSDNLQTTDFENWEEIADAMRDVQEAHSELLSAMAHRGDVPKSVYVDLYDDLSDTQSQLKSDLEDRMFEEHPDKADTAVFYGGN